MTTSKEFASAKAGMRGVYTRHAYDWDTQRPRNLYEQAWLDRFLANVPSDGNVLELGCGGGDPVSRYILGRGYHLTGIDYSPSMIAIATERFPQAVWQVRDMTALSLTCRFDGVLSWDGFFHISVSEQRKLIPHILDHLTDKAAILFTVGPSEGETLGIVQGEPVYHASLAPEEYQELMRKGGLSNIMFKPNDPDCLGRSILLAWR